MNIPHIPTAAEAPGSMTRQQVTAALAALGTRDEEPLSHWADQRFSEDVADVLGSAQ